MTVAGAAANAGKRLLSALTTRNTHLTVSGPASSLALPPLLQDSPGLLPGGAAAAAGLLSHRRTDTQAGCRCGCCCERPSASAWAASMAGVSGGQARWVSHQMRLLLARGRRRTKADAPACSPAARGRSAASLSACSAAALCSCPRRRGSGTAAATRRGCGRGEGTPAEPAALPDLGSPGRAAATAGAAGTAAEALRRSSGEGACPALPTGRLPARGRPGESGGRRVSDLAAACWA